jgi:crossover junction endodeoxyribonuclease RusA
VPQGSTRAFVPKGWTRPIITADNKKTKPWRQEIAGIAENEIFETDFKPLMNGEPVYVRVQFYFDKPKSAGKKVIHKVTKPDIDKLLRSLFDALTGIVFKDDSQIVECEVQKRFGSPARCEVKVGAFPVGAV